MTGNPIKKGPGSYLFLLLLFLVSSGSTQSYISGEITQSTRWQGTIRIDGDVTVPPGVILTVMEGTRVYFKPKTDTQKSGKDKERAEIIVNGVLMARSTNSLNPIIFSSESRTPQMNDWYGITIKNFYNQSQLENCVVEFAYKGVTCYGSSPLISGGEYRFNHNSGISCEVKASPVIRNAVILGNGFAGINCELASNPVVSGCTISENNYGVVILSRSTPDLGTWPVAAQGSGGENRIYNNFDYDIYNHSGNNILAQNNIWLSLTPPDIQVVIFDRNDNAAYGEVTFLPLFRERRVPPATTLALGNPGTAVTPSENPVDTTGNARPLPDSSGTESGDLLADLVPTDTLITNALLSQTPSLEIREVRSTDLLAAETVVSASNIPPESVLNEPIMEGFLDTKKREYVRRVTPVYPRIYLQTGTQGVVLIEVVVNRLGGISDYRILKTDGELFTESAVEALKKFQYKVGKLNDKPVSFKVIERFQFKLN